MMEKGIRRREFISMAAAASVAPGVLKAADGESQIKAFLMHLGGNMWCEWLPENIAYDPESKYKPNLKLRTKDELWRKVIDHVIKRGMNMVVIDLGEGVQYPSHPELALEGTWPVQKLKDEIKRLRDHGVEAIPKLNFSATHDGWLKDYHRMLTLPKYYEVVKDLIRDVVDIFDGPRFFHLGYDEETTGYAKGRNYFVMRSGEMWWHDFLFTVDCVQKAGARPWVWSDYGWHHKEYFTRCPKSVVQSDWYYDEANADFSLDPKKNSHWFRLNEILELEAAGFDQIPCGTNWVGWKRKADGVGADDVIGKLVKFSRKHVAKERLLGFMMAPWSHCSDQEGADFALRAADLFAEALKQES